MTADQQQAHALLDRVPAEQLATAVRFLEFLLSQTGIEDEEISEDEERAVACSKEWFMHNEGVPFEQFMTELGFSMREGGQSAPATRPLASQPTNHNRVERQEETTSPLQERMETAKAKGTAVRKGQTAA
jgi:hypothetical protein